MSKYKTDEMVAPGVRYAFGQYHATVIVKGRIKSRYFTTKQGAIKWRERQAALNFKEQPNEARNRRERQGT